MINHRKNDLVLVLADLRKLPAPTDEMHRLQPLELLGEVACPCCQAVESQRDGPGGRGLHDGGGGEVVDESKCTGRKDHGGEERELLGVGVAAVAQLLGLDAGLDLQGDGHGGGGGGGGWFDGLEVFVLRLMVVVRCRRSGS